MKLDKNSALIVVDMQNDFLPGGSLPVKDGDKIIPVINNCIRKFKEQGLNIFATRDWHPEDHISFKERGGPWPKHCVQNTKGAEFHKDLELDDAIIISKAMDRDKEAYSGFEGTDLKDRLKQMDIKKVFVTGVATDYCVKNTALDAIKHGFEVYLIRDGVKGIHDEEKAIEEMRSKGVKVIESKDI
ncbi:MAG: bifunctional pyrazinamidase/nicotinamidase [Candidatus Nitrosocaldaceae archaeon]|nr:MAG: bifunctional pyrazinamidase/nicotinamidase [Candidatus Nitrosocaldaceae archaeon]